MGRSTRCQHWSGWQHLRSFWRLSGLMAGGWKRSGWDFYIWCVGESKGLLVSFVLALFLPYHSFFNLRSETVHCQLINAPLKTSIYCQIMMPGASQTEISMSPIFNECQVTHALFQLCMKKKLTYKYSQQTSSLNWVGKYTRALFHGMGKLCFPCCRTKQLSDELLSQRLRGDDSILRVLKTYLNCIQGHRLLSIIWLLSTIH